VPAPNTPIFSALLLMVIPCFGFKVQCSEFNGEPGTWNVKLTFP
jgi:hypothetical protein